MDINDLMYDDDLEEPIEQDSDDVIEEEPIQTQEPDGDDTHDALEDFLKFQGIEDIHKIKFDDDNGDVIERDWNDLDYDEQLNILKSTQNNPETELDDDEIDLINRIRASRMTPSQYIESLKPQEQIQEPEYVIDSLSDDELYLLDLQTRMGLDELTEEQETKLREYLDKAKESPELFEKQIQGIREEYKRLEQDKNMQQQAEQEERLQQQYETFSNNIIGAIQNLKNIGDLDVTMEQDDSDQLASFILDRDETGTSYFARALNDPNELVKMAWFALNGEEVFNDISDYYKKQISQVSKTNYQKGYDDALSGKKSTLVVKPTKKTQTTKVQSIGNLQY